MAFRRSLTARVKLFYQQQQLRVAIPLTRADRDDNDRRQLHGLRRGGGGNAGGFPLGGWRNLCGDRRFASPAAYTPLYHVRNMSSNGEGRGAENVPTSTDSFEMIEETAENAIEAVAPVADEVAAAAAKIFPLDLHHLIDHVHTFSGCNWLTTIALSTVLIRTLVLPFAIHQTRATYIFTLIRPQVEEIQDEIAKSKNEKNPFAVALGEEWMRKLFNEYGFNRFNNFVSLMVVLYVNHCYFFTITPMIFKAGPVNDGDAFFIFPLLTALTFWRAVKCHGDEKISGMFCGVSAALIIPVAAILPKGMLCYWMVSNVYGLAYGTMMKNGKVKKMLGIPNIAEELRSDPFVFAVPASSGEWLVPVMLFCLYLLISHPPLAMILP